MRPERVVPGCWRIGLLGVNAYLVEGESGLVLVDTGTKGAAGRLVAAVQGMGRSTFEIGDILLTHQHSDHAGGLARLADLTEARVHVHSLDAPEIRQGKPSRQPVGRGRLGRRLFARFSPGPQLGPAVIDHELADGDVLAGDLGIEAIHTPGHTAGHTAFLWPGHGGVLFAGDAVTNFLGRLRRAPVGEDWDAADRSAGLLADREFATAVFGHGRVLRGDAVGRIRRFAERIASG
jgi:glyoxylase-like metal-dependent hydrolase (beta-lactamase superfamily II)